MGMDGETRHVISSVDEGVITLAYESLSEEINSLRQYDMGEKKIDAPDLRNLVQSV